MNEKQISATQSTQGKSAIAVIKSGACGFVTTVKAVATHKRVVCISIESTCPNIAKMAGEITELDAYQEISWRGGSTVYQSMARHSRHTSCPVGSGILKAMEVAAGLAVQQDVSISVRVDEG